MGYVAHPCKIRLPEKGYVQVASGYWRVVRGCVGRAWRESFGPHWSLVLQRTSCPHMHALAHTCLHAVSHTGTHTGTHSALMQAHTQNRETHGRAELILFLQLQWIVPPALLLS